DDRRAAAPVRAGPGGDAPDGLRAIPTPGAGEVLVRVRASSIDRGTWHLLTGRPYPMRLAGFGFRRPTFGNPGLNFAGTVEAVGEGVTGFAPGDEVFGIGRATLAEYAAAPAAKLALRPA